MNLLEKIIFQNTVQEYIYSLALFFVSFFIFRFFRKILILKLDLLVKKTRIKFDDIIVDIFKDIPTYFYWFLSMYVSLIFLTIPSFLQRWLYYILILLLTWEFLRIVRRLIKYFFNSLSEKKDGRGKKPVFNLMEKVSIAVLYIFSLLFILSSFGIDITALVAGLGVSGIVIGFALQSILADLFSYFTILLDQPIEIGDFITVNGESGSVKKIGIKTTRLVGGDGRELIVSNNAISSGLIENSGKREYRRIKFILGVAYDTPVEKLKKIKESIKEIVEQEEKSEFLRTHFKNFGDSALEFVVDYKLNTIGYDEYADTKERINFAILEFCERENIEIAYPSMTIYQK